MEKQTEQREFKLETILSVITGQLVVPDYDDVIEFAQIVYMDPLMNTISFQIIRTYLINHIFNIHPELKGIKYDAEIDGDLNEWVENLKKQYGETLPISIVENPLIPQKKEKEKVKTLRA